MSEISSHLPDRETLISACEHGCGASGECFLANIRNELTATAFNAVTDNEALGNSQESFDPSFLNKANTLKEIESILLAKCSLERAVDTMHPRTA